MIAEFLPEIFVAVTMLSVGWLSGYLRASKEWKNKIFLDKVTLTLNHISFDKKGKVSLRVRTLFEKKLADLYVNRAMLDVVIKAIRKTDSSNPLLLFSEEEAWHILNPILNKIAELYSLQTMRMDAGMEVEKRTYLFCLTFENEADVRSRKPRIFITEKDKFLEFPDEGEVDVISASHHMKGRVQTLRLLKQKYKETPYLFKAIDVYL